VTAPGEESLGKLDTVPLVVQGNEQPAKLHRGFNQELAQAGKHRPGEAGGQGEE
jgi:hypothetical protein